MMILAMNGLLFIRQRHVLFGYLGSGHISYHYNRALDRDRDLPAHKRARQQAPASSVTSRRIATPSRRTRPDAPLNFNFEESYSPAAPAPPASSDEKTGSGLTSQEQSKRLSCFQDH
ncbi:hypothetical protein G6F45_013417 [Rhizopus arrhizus]|nr:hypothetical protein G6F45_013417 [Rhizopus arrhizus]